jgi:hypothetical protein
MAKEMHHATFRNLHLTARAEQPKAGIALPEHDPGLA